VLCREAESRDELFVSTRWTMVLKAGDSAATSVQALSALSELCQIYWRNPFFMPRARVEFRESPPGTRLFRPSRAIAPFCMVLKERLGKPASIIVPGADKKDCRIHRSA